MARLNEQKPCWTSYPPLLSMCQTDQERDNLDEAAMAHRCGRFSDAKAIFDRLSIPIHSTPMLTMELADMLTTQGDERERIRLLETTLRTHKAIDDTKTTIERLLLELMLMDAHFWAGGRMKGLLTKCRQIAAQLSHIGYTNLDYVEVRFPLLYH